METHPVPPVALLDEPISKLFKEHPHLVGLFIQRRMACGICCFASFCSLRDVLKIYDLSSGFLDEIYDRIRPGQWVGSPN